MKSTLCVVATVLASAGYGWGLGDALKVVDKAKETVQNVDNAVNETIESTVGGTKVSQSKSGSTKDAPKQCNSTESKVSQSKSGSSKDDPIQSNSTESTGSLVKSIYAVYQECDSKIENSQLGYEVKQQRGMDTATYFAGHKQKKIYNCPNSFAITLDQAKDYKEKLFKELDDFAALPTSTDEAALLKAVEDEGMDWNFRSKIAKQLISVTKNASLLMSFYNGKNLSLISQEDRMAIPSRIADSADSITDTNVVVTILKDDNFNDPAKREKLLSKLDPAFAMDMVKGSLRYHGVHSWNEGKLGPIDDAVCLMKTANGESAAMLVSMVLAKFDEYEKECKNSWTMRWGDEDVAKIKQIVGRFPKLEDTVVEAVICSKGTGWKHIIDKVSADVACSVLAGGKAKSADLEVALVKIIPDKRIDMKVYNGTKTEAAKKALAERMPPEMKASAEKAAKEAYAKICKQAKSAAKETFELDGFYLGMTFDDAKIVLAHHFPDLKIKEAVDGEGKDADHVIYLPGQKSPFCFASVGDNKVWLFNFGKKLLTKWYDFDKQTYIEWAAAYGNKTKADMRFKLVEKDTTVYEDDMSDSYTVWFHQEAYQYKNSKKGYLLTYFGEERETTIEGGLGGQIIKERAAPAFKYTRGDPGSLRVRVVKD